jgi:hypothetical protein
LLRCVKPVFRRRRSLSPGSLLLYYDRELLAAQLHLTYSWTGYLLLFLILLSIMFVRAQHPQCCYLSPLGKRPWIPESPWQSNMRVSGDVVRRDGVGTKRTTSWDNQASGTHCTTMILVAVWGTVYWVICRRTTELSAAMDPQLSQRF